MVSMGETGIDYALREAKDCEAEQEAEAKKLKGIAKEISFNMGVNTWPGWNDPGIVIDESARKAGFQAARLNHQLAIELKRDQAVLANAEWLVGAHHLAAEEYTEAIQVFERASVNFAQANKPDAELMAKGYRALALILAKDDAEQGKREWMQARQKLEEINSDDARFYLEQLSVARQVFEK